MCGLFGFSRTTDTTRRMTPTLALMMGNRGRDSWGVTDGEYIFKMVGDIADTFVDMGLEAPLYHTRHGTVGVVSERNAHPFEVISATKRVVGAHNGHISNYQVIKDKYPDRAACEVDSEQIFHHLATDQDLGEIGGYGAVIWYEHPLGKPEERVRYFSRWNGDNLHFIKLKSGEVAFASTESSLMTAARLADAEVDIIYKTFPLKKYWLNTEGELMYDQEDLKWSKNPLSAPALTYSHGGSMGYGSRFVAAGAGGGSGHSRYDRDTCAMRDCRTKVTSTELVCANHYLEATKEIYGGDRRYILAV